MLYNQYVQTYSTIIMILSSISINFSSFEVSLNLLSIIGLVRLVGGIVMKLNYGKVKACERDEITIELISK